DGFELPEGGLVDATLARGSAEQIYVVLKKRREAEQERERQAAEEQEEEGDEESDEAGDEEEESDEGDGGDSSENDEGDEAEGEGAGGAGGGGAGEAPAEDSGGAGSSGEPPARELADVPGAVLDAPSPATDEAEWQVNVDQALKAAAMMGQSPGSGVAELVKKANRPRTDWKAILRQFAQQSAAADYSWRLPNPRYM